MDRACDVAVVLIFQHVGGNFQFCGSNRLGCNGICMGGRDKRFSSNVDLMSLGCAHGVTVKVRARERATLRVCMHAVWWL